MDVDLFTQIVDTLYMVNERRASMNIPCATHLIRNGRCMDCGLTAQRIRQLQMEREFGRPAQPGHHLTRNLLSKRVIEVADDTPLCCDPSSETYHCM